MRFGGEKIEFFKLEDDYYPWINICENAIMEKSFRKWRLHYVALSSLIANYLETGQYEK